MPLYQAGRLKINCQIAGRGQSCVLIHGSFVDGSFWREQMSILSQEFRIVVPDLRGHGLSGKPFGHYTPQVLAKDLMNLLGTLGIEQVSLVGHSMGVKISLQLALDYPRLVKKMVLASGSAGPVRNRQEIFPKRVKEEIGLGTPHFDEKKFTYYEIWYSFAKPSPDEVNRYLEKVLETPPHVRSSVAKDFAQIDFRPRLSDIQAPALVIAGERDVICPVEESVYLAQNLPKARLEIVPETGHCLPIEKPLEFNKRVTSFLKEDFSQIYSNAKDLSDF